jgi:YidC/Oxa1 family membrane protein insertase
VWDLLIINPMVNAMLLFYGLLGQQFILAIIALTIFIRIIVFPLSLKQQRSMSMMQAMQRSKEWQDIQKKYKGDREKLSQEQMRMYREFGVNPAGGCLPTLIQFPVLIGLYQSILRVLAVSPLDLVDLASRVYLPGLAALIPLNDSFLWLNLGKPDPVYVLPVLVVATTWAQQKLLTPPNPDPQAAGMNQTMQYMMPLMFGFFALSFSSALSIYFIVSNVVGVVQYAAINRWFRERWEQDHEVARSNRTKESRAEPSESRPTGQPAPAKRRKKKRVKKKQTR